jgi:proteic killer suppression protein
VIRSFSCRNTELFWLGQDVPRFRALRDAAVKKLKILDVAKSLHDLNLLPGNHLKKLGGDRKGQYSLRINDQWRVCFVWTDGYAHDVEIVDYH